MRRRNFLKAMLVSPLLGLAKGEKGLSGDEVLVLEPDITYYKYIPDGNPFLGSGSMTTGGSRIMQDLVVFDDYDIM